MTQEAEVRQESQTLNAVSPGAEKWMFQRIPVLDLGYVELVGCFGNDATIEQMARISYGSGTRSVSERRRLIRRLMRDDHTSPFEGPVLQFRILMPVVVERQHNRHRTGSQNSESGRYKVMEARFYTIAEESVRLQSPTNKQGAAELAPPDIRQATRRYMTEVAEFTYQRYQAMLDAGVARETARMVLPFTLYTEMVWQMNLHNLFHYLKLRLNDDAQPEIQAYARAIAQIVADAFPIAWQAFVDYQLEAAKITRPELEVIKSLGLATGLFQIAACLKEAGLTNQRERLGTMQKLRKLGLLRPKATAKEVEAYCDVLELSPARRKSEVEGLVAAGLTLEVDG